MLQCPNEICVFGRPVGGTNRSMRKETMDMVDVASDVNSGGRKIILKAESAHDSILLVHARLRHNSRVSSTIDVLENALLNQRQHVRYRTAGQVCCAPLIIRRHLYKLNDLLKKLYFVALKKTEAKERPLSEIAFETYMLNQAFTSEFLELISKLIVISNEFHDLILQQLSGPISHKTFLNICA